jgi:hypothetical protein
MFAQNVGYIRHIQEINELNKFQYKPPLSDTNSY